MDLENIAFMNPNAIMIGCSILLLMCWAYFLMVVPIQALRDKTKKRTNGQKFMYVFLIMLGFAPFIYLLYTMVAGPGNANTSGAAPPPPTPNGNKLNAGKGFSNMPQTMTSPTAAAGAVVENPNGSMGYGKKN
jgi:hypothetical protein